ncbi:hypothetical protein F5141DRAFT_1214924 [Pisolithus sp. B1]|nr:hypothetical protein F5141DRAFT_1214924 [Pisolithus sp. B1]
MESDKIAALQDYIAPELEAQACLQIYFKKELLVLKLEENEVGKTKEVNGIKVWMHVMWAKEVMRLAKAAKVEKDIGLVWIVHKRLPKVIHSLMKNKYKDFKELMKEVKGLDVDEIKWEKEDADEQKKDDEEREK